MPTQPLSHRPHKPRAGIALMDGAVLARGRAHEACGPARHAFALWLAAAAGPGSVLWITPAWQAETLHPDGMQDFTCPARFLFVTAERPSDLLWSVEEALRSGAAPLVVADLPDPPAMTPVRRLHLAAETGGAAGPAPLALLLTPGTGGAQGIESRWHMAPAHSARRRQWQLERLRARTEPPQSWQVAQARPGALPAPLPGPVSENPPGPGTAQPGNGAADGAAAVTAAAAL